MFYLNWVFKFFIHGNYNVTTEEILCLPFFGQQIADTNIFGHFRCILIGRHNMVKTCECLCERQSVTLSE